MKHRFWKTAVCLLAAVAMLLPMASPMVAFAETVSKESLATVTLDADALYNGITIPDNWTFSFQDAEGDRITPPYLVDANGYGAAVINIDKGRQLFVDNFLIRLSFMKRKPVVILPQY